ncbi:MAG: hypothetical protein HDS26_05255 [Bacteroides sp.]|nr:hypothetical protein [Bacteroides sp.]
MSNNDKIQKVAEKFRESLGFPKVSSKTGSELLFDSDLFTALFRERFGITSENKDAFNASFRDVTEGVGGEISKINSVVSSALLPLLVFYKLYLPKKGNTITLNIASETITFNRAFFEVRNKVVGFPSCVDVALVSQDAQKRCTILFLESKLTEMFEDTTDCKEYGSSYKPLYEKKGIKRALNENGITIDDSVSNLVLHSDPQYLEGIKQTISHLIGLVKGPQEDVDQSAYIDVYKNAHRLIYSPILYDVSTILDNQASEYTNFSRLYSKVIGDHGNAILEDIREWCNTTNNKVIEINPKPITYQDLAQQNPRWLDERVAKYYSLKNQCCIKI